ncbi:NitT/TauT family transport system substrate-binding protein [Actinocorallia herbida]|uniref:NitT/TauT family transport system substrate-binding protein n=1 Tax=Actinocorallia herbida TaxID=58109 RepID=A0A3N1CYM5_9ACTN|nr:ABC transporter substrate-binding protein [Actinocorallia herbida]ROO86379.1 NitT/TauT family transport system substrate-binding protein [Actinocorallia herbida]
MLRIFSRLAGTAAAAVLLLGAAACGGADDGGDGDDKVKVGVIPIVDVAPIYLGKDKGFFSSRGIDLTLDSAQGGAAIVPGVVSGQFQFGFSNVTSLLIAQTKNVPVKAVANGVASTGEAGADFGAVVVKKGSPITSAKDLAGKKVSVNTLKNIGDTSVRESVRKDGGDPSKVEFVEIAFPQMPAALDAGQVDAAWMVEPSLSQAKAAGAVEIASNFVDVAPNLTVALYFTSEKTIADDPDLVRRFTEAMKESLAYADANPAEVRRILTTYTKIDAATLDTMRMPRWPAEPDRPSLQALSALGQSDGLFATAPDLDALLP